MSTQEWVNGEFITIRDEFKDFDSSLECVQYLVDRWYKDYKGYKGVNRAEDRDSAAYLLKEEGYATDPTYPQKLIRLMDDYQEEVVAEPVVEQEPSDSFIPNAVRYFNEEPHQVAAWEGLWGELDPAVKEWFMAAYRGEIVDIEPEEPATFPLDVPYFYQRDSKTGHGERMCFSSSMAMALDYINPDAIEGDDDWYLNEVFKYGDSVSSSAQVAAPTPLASLQSSRWMAPKTCCWRSWTATPLCPSAFCTMARLISPQVVGIGFARSVTTRSTSTSMIRSASLSFSRETTLKSGPTMGRISVIPART